LAIDDDVTCPKKLAPDASFSARTVKSVNPDAPEIQSIEKR